MKYLTDHQSDDGYWIDFQSPNAGLSTQWVTGYIAFSLRLFNAQSVHATRAGEWLLRTELQGGGWGYKENFLADADSTANALRLFVSDPQYQNIDLVRVGDLLLSFQDKNTGGFITYKPKSCGIEYMSERSAWCRPEITVSAMVGLALLLVDAGRYKKALEQIKYFLLESQADDGYWESFWWDTRFYGINVVCNLLSNLGEQHAVRRAIDWLLDHQSGEGEWGNGYEPEPSPFSTSLAVATLSSSEDCSIKYEKVIAKGIAWLAGNQQPDGSWESTAVVREPEPGVYTPWEDPYRSKVVMVHDTNRLFTTAAVIKCLC